MGAVLFQEYSKKTPVLLKEPSDLNSLPGLRIRQMFVVDGEYAGNRNPAPAEA